jgi:threonine aldolase
VERLAADHDNARRLAAGFERLGLGVPVAPESNIVLVRVPDTRRFAKLVLERMVLMNPVADGVFRAVTHLDVTTDDIDDALHRVEEARFW